MEDKNYKVAISCLGVIGVLFSIPLVLVFSGWTLSVVWNMLMVKAFALPALTVPKAIAIDLVLGWLTYHYVKDERKYVEQLLTLFFSNFLFIFIGYIVSFFI